jgi:hypothetical protein
MGGHQRRVAFILGIAVARENRADDARRHRNLAQPRDDG